MSMKDAAHLITADKTNKANKEIVNLLRELVAEQKRSNELLAYLADRAHAQASGG